MNHVGGTLRSYGVDATEKLASGSSVDEFRALVRDLLDRPGHHVIVNYDRAALEQVGGGHTSPLAAYHAASDRVLILDVCRYKNPPIWVEVGALFDAMRESIPDGSRSRGFVHIRQGGSV